MTKTSTKTNAPATILDAIKGGEELAKQQAHMSPEDVAARQAEEDAAKAKDEADKPMTWGAFTVEVGVAPPSRSQANTKYDWSLFPAPANPEDPKTWPSVFIKDVGGKTISGSIKTYRDRLQKAGAKEVPEFTVSVSKDPKGVRVFRKK